MRRMAKVMISLVLKDSFPEDSCSVSILGRLILNMGLL